MLLDRREFMIDAGLAAAATLHRGKDSTVRGPLEKRCRDGLTSRYRGHPAYWINGDLAPVVSARLHHELAVLEERGLVDDVLALGDIIDRVHQAGGIAGIEGPPAGSLVIYALGAKQICPLRHKLMFERAIAPAKIVIWVHADRESKRAVFPKARERNGVRPEIAEAYPRYVYFRERSNEVGGRQEHFAIGMTGSPHLQALKTAERKFGVSRHQAFERSPAEDARAYASILAGDVADLPQFRSYDFPEFFKSVGPTSPDDLAAAIALYRPGPLSEGVAGAFRTAKASAFPAEELRETRGQLVYQEQAMSLMHRIAGIDLIDAYRLLVEFGNRKHRLRLSTHQRLLRGGLAQGMSLVQAKSAADTIIRSGPTSFCKATAFKHADHILEIAVLRKRIPQAFRAAAAELD